jgi:hypothetical protein
MILSDPLHVIFLGFGRDFVGSFIKLLVLSGVFAGSSWDVRMESAFAAFYLFAKQNKFSVSILNFGIKQPPKYETVHGKASDIKFMISWVAEVSLQFKGEHAELLQAAAYCLAE